MDIGRKIRERREELGMTQDELAKKLGYASRSSVNKVENSREVSMKKIEKYAIALETTVAYLMDWEEVAKIDLVLSDLPLEIKEYAIKLSSLKEAQKKHVFDLIDMLTKEM